MIGLLDFALPAIFWEETELSSSRREAVGFEVPSASHPGPLCHMRNLGGMLWAGAWLPSPLVSLLQMGV